MSDDVKLYAYSADDREVVAVIAGPDKPACEQAAKDYLCSEFDLTFDPTGLTESARTNYVQL